MNRRLPPLLAVRAFEGFSRWGSVRQCAEELSVSHTVISRHIQNLETAVGTKLVRKSGRGLEMTREGQRYAAQLRRALDIIADASSDLRQGEDALHVCCMAGLASRRLLGRLGELEEALNGRELTFDPRRCKPGILQSLSRGVQRRGCPGAAADPRTQYAALVAVAEHRRCHRYTQAAWPSVMARAFDPRSSLHGTGHRAGERAAGR